MRTEDVLDVGVRVSVELGRARLPVAEVLHLSRGSVVDLDREADAPVDIYVNGLLFGTGRLMAVDGEWAVRLESVEDAAESARSA